MSTSRALLVLALAFAAIASSPADARRKKTKTYTDTKDRFELTLPRGWKLAPMPGDTGGMAFRKDVDDAFALFRVQVRPVLEGERLDDAVSRATLPLAAEIGYRQGASIPTTLGPISATRRSVSVYVSGDSRMVRSAEITVAIAFGFVHTLHFESLEQHRPKFRRDLDLILASYKALAGRRVYAPLVGRWESTTGDANLYLGEDLRFTLGKLSGTFLADGGAIVLRLDEGQERYSYRLNGRRLTLNSPNLPEPSQYERRGANVFGDNDRRKKRSSRLTRDQLVGRWRIIDHGGSDPGTMILAPSGAIAFGGLSGQWRYRRGLLTVTSAAGRTVTYHISKDGEGLIIGGGDFDREVRMRPE